MRILQSLAILAALAVPVASAHADSITYSAVGNFSIASNPNGVWSYGFGTPGGAVTLDTYSGTNYSGGDAWTYWSPTLPGTLPVVADGNGTGFGTIPPVPVNVLEMHPSSGGPGGIASIVQFTAPNSGEYYYSGFFERIDGSNGAGFGADGEIYAGADDLYTEHISTSAYGNEVKFSGLVYLTAGETLDFDVAASNTNIGNDSTGLSAFVTETPEPSSLALFGTGVLGLAGVARRRFRS